MFFYYLLSYIIAHAIVLVWRAPLWTIYAHRTNGIKKRFTKKRVIAKFLFYYNTEKKYLAIMVHAKKKWYLTYVSFSLQKVHVVIDHRLYYIVSLSFCLKCIPFFLVSFLYTYIYFFLVYITPFFMVHGSACVILLSVYFKHELWEG